MSTPVLWGDEFVVNTTTPETQFDPDVAALGDGRWVVVWTDSSRLSADSSITAIRAQVFRADGSPQGGELLVNTTTLATQQQPSVTALADGRFVVSWTDFSETGGDTSDLAVRAQMFRADGSALGPELLLNTTTTGSQLQPVVAGLSDGSWVAVWTDGDVAGGGDTSSSGIRGQRFDADGRRLGSEFRVNTTVLNAQQAPDVTALEGGGFVVVWADSSGTGADTSFSAIRGQVYRADGGPAGAEFLANTTTTGSQFQGQVLALANGRFVVSWTDTGASGGDTSSFAVRAQVFESSGRRSGSEFLVNTTTSGSQSSPAMAALPDGRFVVVWGDGSETDGDFLSGVRAQVFLADGSKSGTEFRVNSSVADNQREPAVSALADGRFVVTWTDNSQGIISGADIRAQIFDPRTGPVTLVGEITGDDLVGTVWNDVLYGGFGNDSLAGGNGYDQLHGEWGNDTLLGNGGNDRLHGAQGDDVLLGGAGSDELWGDVGHDTLNGGAGNDAMIGGLGDDAYVVDTEADLVMESDGEGTDSVRSAHLSLDLARFAYVENAQLLGTLALNLTGSALGNGLTGNAGANTLLGLAGNDTLAGAAGNDRLDGGLDHDRLDGGSGNDSLLGGAGNDTLYGGVGRDVLNGGSGGDVFVWRTAAEAGSSMVFDVVADFAVGVDKLDLRTIDADIKSDGHQVFAFVKDAVFSGLAGELRYEKGRLQADTNGDGAAEFQIQLNGFPALTALDLWL